MIQKCDRIEEQNIKIPVEKEYKYSTAICESIILLMLLITVMVVINILS